MAPSGWTVGPDAVAESAQDAPGRQDSAQVPAKSVRVFTGTAREAQELLEQASREQLASVSDDMLLWYVLGRLAAREGLALDGRASREHYRALCADAMATERTA